MTTITTTSPIKSQYQPLQLTRAQDTVYRAALACWNQHQAVSEFNKGPKDEKASILLDRRVYRQQQPINTLKETHPLYANARNIAQGLKTQFIIKSVKLPAGDPAKDIIQSNVIPALKQFIGLMS